MNAFPQLAIAGATGGASAERWQSGYESVASLSDAVLRSGSGLGPIADTPTTQKYFTHAMRPYIARPGKDDAPIKPVEGNVFECFVGGVRTVLIFRFCSRRLAEQLLNDPPERLVLFIDENLWALKNASLSEGYRYRLARKREALFEPLLAIAHEVVSPSRRILARFDTKERFLVGPALTSLLPALDHHDNGDTTRIVFCGSRSQVEELENISGELNAFMADHPDVNLTTFLGRHAPRDLQGPNIAHMVPMVWSDYRRCMEINRFHISIAPAASNEFNLSRSLSRVLDNAVWGAAGLYSNQEPYSQTVADGSDGLLVGRERGDWTKAISQLVNDRRLARNLALQGQNLALAVGDIARLSRFWMNRLGIVPERVPSSPRANTALPVLDGAEVAIPAVI